MSGFPPHRPRTGRAAVASVATSALALVWSHALMALLTRWGAAQNAELARPLTWGALALALMLSVRSGERVAWRSAAIAGTLAALGVCATVGAWAPGAFALVFTALGAAVCAHQLYRQLPTWLDDFARNRRGLSALWLLSAVVAIVQLARLSTWISDPSADWFLSTTHPFWAKHECLSAYVHGAELALRGDPNVYAAHHYPGLTPEAAPATSLQHVVIEDPFQYAPQFLIWPAGLLGLSWDYPTLRALWFALNTTLLLAAATAFGLWLRGRPRHVSLALIPTFFGAFPVLHTLQYGQFHLAAVALGVAAMIAFRSERKAVGGALLAVATLSKLFPGVLVFVLLGQRKWRELGYTAFFAAILTGVAWRIFGGAPFVAFFEYHLPRLQSGAAFAFGDAYPEIKDLIIADNQGVFGLVLKLEALGFTALTEQAAIWLNRVYAIAVAGLAVYWGHSGTRASRESQLAGWVSLVGLASLMSTGAFGDYVPATGVWLVTLVAFKPRSAWAWAGLGIAGIVQYSLLGTSPLGNWFEPELFTFVSAVAALMLLGLFAGGLVPSFANAARAWRASAPPVVNDELRTSNC